MIMIMVNLFFTIMVSLRGSLARIRIMLSNHHGHHYPQDHDDYHHDHDHYQPNHHHHGKSDGVTITITIMIILDTQDQHPGSRLERVIGLQTDGLGAGRQPSITLPPAYTRSWSWSTSSYTWSLDHDHNGISIVWIRLFLLGKDPTLSITLPATCCRSWWWWWWWWWGGWLLTITWSSHSSSSSYLFHWSCKYPMSSWPSDGSQMEGIWRPSF